MDSRGPKARGSSGPLARAVLRACWRKRPSNKESPVNNLIYLVGLVVVVIAVLSFFGLR
jgi:hypothetical protein